MHRPEAWYTVAIKDEDIWEPLLKSVRGEVTASIETLAIKEAIKKRNATMEEVAQLIKEIKYTSMEQVAQRIREKAEQLGKAEREVFLKRQIWKIVRLATEEFQASIYLEASNVWKIGKEKNQYIHSVLSIIFNKHLEEYLKVLVDYPEYTMEVLLDQIIKDEDTREEVLREEGLKK
jgi:hypothetical protein